ncbi:hypothetical protein TNCV_4385871 [Trichonephila clavipes]|nr:hypothetical protein TNCV_4385871 [Trichonephila clavipes]
MGPGERSKTQCRLQDLSDSICKGKWKSCCSKDVRYWRKLHKGVGKNEMTIINMSKKKCALSKGVTKWPILEESVANWVLENRLN